MDAVDELISWVRPEARGILTSMDGSTFVRIELPEGVPYSNHKGLWFNEREPWQRERDRWIDVSDQFEADVVREVEPSAVVTFANIHDNVSHEFRKAIAPKLRDDKFCVLPCGQKKAVVGYWNTLRDMYRTKTGKGKSSLAVVLGLVVENPRLSAAERDGLNRATAAMRRIIKELVNRNVLGREDLQADVGVSVSENPGQRQYQRRYRLTVDGVYDNVLAGRYEDRDGWLRTAMLSAGRDPLVIVPEGFESSSAIAEFYEALATDIESAAASSLRMGEGLVVENPWSPI